MRNEPTVKSVGSVEVGSFKIGPTKTLYVWMGKDVDDMKKAELKDALKQMITIGNYPYLRSSGGTDD